MDDFVSKPFDPAGLVLLLRQHLERVRGGRLPVAARAAGAPLPVTEPWPPLDGIDGDEARQRLQGDVSFFAQLLARLLDEFADLAEAPAQPPPAQATAARLHKLGGNAALLAARALRDAAHRGERQARAGADFSTELADVRRLLAALAAQARPWLATREAGQQAAPPGPAAPLDASVLQRLHLALQAQDLGALDLFERLAPALRERLGDAAFARLRAAVARLDFATAVGLLGGAPDVSARSSGDAPA